MQVVYHLTRLYETRVFITLYCFVVTLDQKAITTNEANAPYEKVFVIYSEKLVTSFLDLTFFEVLRIVEEN